MGDVSGGHSFEEARIDAAFATFRDRK